MGEVFPDTKIPIVEHLTYVEAHKFLRGLWIGFAIALFLYVDQRGAAVALVERAHKRQQSKHQDKTAPNKLKGLKADAWYLSSGVVVGFVVTRGVLYLFRSGTVAMAFTAV